MFHLELRQFPHVARAFNLTREELDERFARPWAGGAAVEHEERRWLPDRARLTIFEGPELRVEEIGLGRGWATVGKTSVEVTDTVLAQARDARGDRSSVQTLKATIRAAARTPITFGQVVELALANQPQLRASAALALAEQAVWELLHQGGLTLLGPDGPIERARWQAVVVGWSTWVDAGADSPRLVATAQ